MKGLTDRQREVLDFIKRYVDEYQYQPTYKEIADQLDVTIHSVSQSLMLIEHKGYITRDKYKRRALRLITPKE